MSSDQPILDIGRTTIGPRARAGNILSQGLTAIIANQERDRGMVALADQFEPLGTAGARMADIMRRDPGAAARMFDAAGGADKLLTSMQTRHASQQLAESMTRLQSQRGDDRPEFDYQGFVQNGLGLGIPLGQLSAAVNAIAAGEDVNLPDIGQTVDYNEIDGKPVRRRVWYDKETGRIVQAGAWSPAFAEARGRRIRVNPQTGEVEIFEGLTAKQQLGEIERGEAATKAISNIFDLVGQIDSTPGVTGIPGAVAGPAASIAGGGARMLNAMVGEELFDPEATEQEMAKRLANITPEQRARYETTAIQVETQVREAMKLGKPSDKDLQLVRDAVKALSLAATPGAIRESLLTLGVMTAKFEFQHAINTGRTPPFDLRTREGALAWRDALIDQEGVPAETAHWVAREVYKEVGTD